MAANGAQGSNGGDADTLSRIQQALEAVHSPYSTNDARRLAQEFLEKGKDDAEAPLQGYQLAVDRSQSPVVRHYALSLLEHAIKYKWSSYTEEQATALRNWVIELNQAVSREDATYLRNKTALLWVEVAKRCWGAEWMDMDAMLVQLWEIPDSPVHKEAVMLILETLSDEVFSGDDSVVAMREGVLSKGCVEIFTPTAVLVSAFPNRQAGPEVRHGQEGWLTRLAEFTSYCVTSEAKENPEVKSCAIKGLSAISSLMPWAIPDAVAAANCVEVLSSALASPHVEVQKGSLEALQGLYSRVNFSDDEFRKLVMPMYSPESARLFKALVEWLAIDPEDIDEDKYYVLKKLAETLSCLGDYVDRKSYDIRGRIASDEFMQVLLQVAQNQSMMVSIPILVTWSKILGHAVTVPNDSILHMIGPLLELCSSRLIRYEHLPQDTQDPTLMFLLEDTDTTPERHAFLGNYRRYSSQIIEAIVQLKITDAMSHVLGQTEQVLQHLYDGQPPFDKSKYSKHSLPALRVDAYFTVIEASLKGFVKLGKRANVKQDQDQLQQLEQLETVLESWCKILLEIKFEDPLIRKRALQLLVYFSTTALNKNKGYILTVLEHILMTWPALEPEHRAYNEAVKDLQSESMVELQRLASEMPDHLLGVYEQIENRVNEMLSSGVLDEKRSVAYQSFLFIIIHRAMDLEVEEKLPKLRQFIDPIKAQWKNESIRSSLESFDGFSQLLGLDKAQGYLVKRQAHAIEDWGSCALDEEGLKLQSDLEERLKTLPLRSTKSFLAFSVEKLAKNSPEFHVSYCLWGEGFSDILSDLLQYLSFAHAAHNPESWTGLPAETRGMVDRVLSDRFWQAGISEGSKDDFYARVMDRKGTMEGLASTIRASVRFVRETAYAIIYCMSRMDLQFYGFAGLGEPLADSLFKNSVFLSTHQQTNLLNLARYLVDDCPVQWREQFLPPLVSQCFRQMDRKISGEWELLSQKQTVAGEGDEALKEEMKAESILRQVTYTAVVMVADFLDPSKRNPRPSAPGLSAGIGSDSLGDSLGDLAFPTLREFCLGRQDVVEPLLVFCTHVIRVRDSRCCSMTLRLLLSVVPEFQGNMPGAAASRKPPTNVHAGTTSQAPQPHVSQELATAVREYISLDVLKACITSFHEPYFVEVQKDLASLIAAIYVYYSPVTDTPKEVLLSLPNVNTAGFDRLAAYVQKPGSHTRQQRAVVMDMLKDLKGVSVSEMGKLPQSNGFAGGRGAKSSRGGGRGNRSKMAQQFMSSEPAALGGARDVTRGGTAARQATPEALEGVSNLFEG